MTLLDDRCRALIAELNLGQTQDVIGVTPLTGGVASDIAKVDLPTGSICVKFALPKLKVSENWEAPVHRNAAEYAWLELASDVHPQSAVQPTWKRQAIFGHNTLASRKRKSGRQGQMSKQIDVLRS